MAFLSVENLSVAFDTRERQINAVQNVSFHIEEGEILGIVGESGSGKSVACYSLLGLLPKPPARIVSGTARLEGIDLLALSESELRAIRGSRVAMIFQDPMTCLNPHMTIARQVMEPLLVHDKLDQKLARQRAIQVLKEVGIRDVESRIDNYPHEFSGGMRQRVMIAMALIKEPDVLIADEPTTALDVTVQAQILALIKKIQSERRLTVIFISHDLAVVSSLADKIIVMESGRVVESGDAQDVLANPQQAYTKKLVAAIPTSAKPTEKQYADDDPPILTVRSLKKTFHRKYGGIFGRAFTAEIQAINDVSLELKRGEILGLVGESGSGKSTLGRSIIRLQSVDSGEVIFDGRNLLSLSAAELQKNRRDYQMIFQDPYASLNPRMTVFDIIAEPMRVHKLVPRNKYIEEVNRLMDEVGLSREMIRKYPHEFSGGQRQRIAIARALAMRPKFIVADEPVSALDVTIQAQILRLLLELTRKYKLAMLFISHDLAVVRHVADRILVMQEGRIVEQGETETLFHNPREEYTKLLLSSVARMR